MNHGMGKVYVYKGGVLNTKELLEYERASGAHKPRKENYQV